MTCNEGPSRHQHDQHRRRGMVPCDVKCCVAGASGGSKTRQGTSAVCVAGASGGSQTNKGTSTGERQKPVQEQEGAVEGLMCGRWLRSRGGLAVHRCARQEEEGQTFRSTLEDQTTESLAVRSPVRETTRMRGATMQVENVTVECKECGQTFRRTSDRKRHKCLAERAKPVKEQRGCFAV